MLKRIIATILLSMSISVYAAEIPIDAKLDYNQGIDFYKLGMYDADEEEDCKDYDEERINNYFYGG